MVPEGHLCSNLPMAPLVRRSTSGVFLFLRFWVVGVWV